MSLPAIGMDFPIRLLAVIGAFALGMAAFGWGLRFASTFFFRQKIPGWAHWTTRTMGGVTLGWLAWLWLFGGGGAGVGGTGGMGVGTGPGSPQEPVAYKSKQDPNQAISKSNGKEKSGLETVVFRVEVLGDSTLKAKARADTFEPTRRYRIPGQNQLLTLEEIRQRIRQALADQQPPQRLEVILYRDSPDRHRPQVSSLVEWAAEQAEPGKKGLDVDYFEKESAAPID